MKNLFANFTTKTAIFEKIYIIFLRSMGTLVDPFPTQNKHTFQKTFATLATRAVFVCPISLLFALKTVNFAQKTAIF